MGPRAALDPARRQAPIRLEDVGAIFFTVDTDGSVLAATSRARTRPTTATSISGACEKYADLPPGGGDPQFPGTDM